MTLSLITHFVQSYGYYAVFTLIALESMGIPLPGETALITAALYAGTTHHLNVVALAAVATCAAVTGDNAGYWIGRTGGLRLAERYGRYVRLDRAKLKVGRYLFARYGVKVVFFGRFIAVLRTFAAFFAGVGKMRWPSFVAANAAGGLLWASFYTLGAYALGNAASSVGSTITIAGYAVASVATVASFIMVRRSLRRLERRAEEALPRAANEAGPSHPGEVAGSQQQRQVGVAENGGQRADGGARWPDVVLARRPAAPALPVPRSGQLILSEPHTRRCSGASWRLLAELDYRPDALPAR
ncbi:MAG: DedA family protein [Trebonia sp.]